MTKTPSPALRQLKAEAERVAGYALDWEKDQDYYGGSARASLPGGGWASVFVEPPAGSTHIAVRANGRRLEWNYGEQPGEPQDDEPVSDVVVFQEKGQAIGLGAFRLTPCALVILGNPTFEEWRELGLGLGAVESSIHWWIGDWMAYGSNRWPEAFSQALGEDEGPSNTAAAEVTGFSYTTVSQDKWIAQAIPPDARRPQLSHSHHRAVAHLKPEERDRMLETAVQTGWSRRDLEAAVRKETGAVTLLPQVCLRCETRLEYELARRGKCGGCGLQFAELMEIAAQLFIALSSGEGGREALARAKGQYSCTGRHADV